MNRKSMDWGCQGYREKSRRCKQIHSRERNSPLPRSKSRCENGERKSACAVKKARTRVDPIIENGYEYRSKVLLLALWRLEVGFDFVQLFASFELIRSDERPNPRNFNNDTTLEDLQMNKTTQNHGNPCKSRSNITLRRNYESTLFISCSPSPPRRLEWTSLNPRLFMLPWKIIDLNSAKHTRPCISWIGKFRCWSSRSRHSCTSC